MELSREKMDSGMWLHVPDYATKFNLTAIMVYDWVRERFIPYDTHRGRVMIRVACGRRVCWRGHRKLKPKETGYGDGVDEV